MVEILLAAYNGEQFIGEQIESVLGQSDRDWHLTITDDCSSDNTYGIAKVYSEMYPDKISLHRNVKNSGSAAVNFFEMLLKFKNSEYVMLADQDDFWMTNKIKYTLRAMKRMEEKYGSDCPVLVHGDLIETDENLVEVAKSVFYKQKLDGKALTFSKLLCQNSVTGCTVMVNKALLNYLNEVPQNMIMHDWWMALVASCFGHIGFISAPLIKYRQHSKNQEGAKDFRSIKNTLKMAADGANIKRSLMLTYNQAAEFKKIYGNRIPEKNMRILKAYSTFPQKNKLEKMRDCFRYGFTKTGINRKIGYWLYL